MKAALSILLTTCACASTPRALNDAGESVAFAKLPICIQSTYDLSIPIRDWNKATGLLALYQEPKCTPPFAVIIPDSMEMAVECRDDDCLAVTTLVGDQLGIAVGALTEVRREIKGQDLRHVLTHELGHVLGLGHSDSEGSVMWPGANNFPWLITGADVRGVREIYP